LKNKLLAVAVLATATVATAQQIGAPTSTPGGMGSYLGPGVLSHGAGMIGQRGGQDVDLRFAAGFSAFYDTGILPVSVNQNGRITEVKGLFGVEGSVQAYGVHRWKRALLGLDYLGNYRYYNADTYYNGSDHRLALGYTFQQSRRIVYDFKGMAGTIMRANSGLGGFYGSVPTDVFNPVTGNLFDSRADFVQGGMDVTFVKSARTTFTMGGDGYAVYRQNKALVGVNGYTLRGSVQHRLSRTTTVGANYEHLHYDFPRAFGESNIDVYSGMYARSLGRLWTMNLSVGAFRAQTEGTQRVALDPAVAALVGTTTAIRAFFADTITPTGNIVFTRQGRQSVFSIRAARMVNPGNGVYLTSRADEGTFGYSYSGMRRWTFGLGVGGGRYSSIGLILQPYSIVSGNATVTYALTRWVHLTARYDRKHQDVNAAQFKRDSGRISIGVMFSPGDLPLSLW
jgi:hypothetical protein